VKFVFLILGDIIRSTLDHNGNVFISEKITLEQARCDDPLYDKTVAYLKNPKSHSAMIALRNAFFEVKATTFKYLYFLSGTVS
jgi:hypothetical protein